MEGVRPVTFRLIGMIGKDDVIIHATRHGIELPKTTKRKCYDCNHKASHLYKVDVLDCKVNGSVAPKYTEEFHRGRVIARRLLRNDTPVCKEASFWALKNFSDPSFEIIEVKS